MALPTPLQVIPAAAAVPVYVSENAIVGRFVFQNFVHEEFVEEGLPEEIISELPVEDSLEEDVVTERNASVDNYAGDANFDAAMQHAGVDPHLMARHVGASIRELAISFAKSKERQKLKEHADQVDLGTITYDSFFAMCEEVFSRGLSKENVIALFYFCADVLIKSVKNGMKQLGIMLFKWAIKFIVDRVCKWVGENGGWENAVRRTFSTITDRRIFYGAGAAFFAVGGIYVYFKYYT